MLFYTGRIIVALVVFALLAVVLIRVFGSGMVSETREGAQLVSVGAEVLFLDAGTIVKRGSTRVVVVRFGSPVDLVPLHFRAEKLDAPLTAEAWAQHLRAPVVFNAGQFDERLEYLGWLKGEGRWLSTQRKPAWKGLLVTCPSDGAVWGRIVDLDHADAEVANRYRNVVQSMMLVDAANKVRVRETDLSASRTVIAEDRRGQLLLILTEGAVTLADLARWLPSTQLGIVRAMNLDGGIESQLVIDTPELRLAIYGQYGTGTAAWPPGAAAQVRYPLPVIIAVRPHSPSHGSQAD